MLSLVASQAGGYSLLDLPLPAQRMVFWLGPLGSRTLAVHARCDRDQHAQLVTRVHNEVVGIYGRRTLGV